MEERYSNPPYDPASWAQIWDFSAFEGRRDNLLTPTGQVQFDAWSQQMVATMYQNWYNSAPEQMKRALEAGINPFVAASGIAGSGGSNGVASAPPIAQSKVPELLGAAGSALGALGSGFGAAVGGVATFMKLKPELDKIGAETQQIFENMGFTKLQSKAMEISLKYLDQKEQIGVWQALATFDKTKAEYNNLVTNHRNIIAQYDEIIAQTDLLKAQEGEVKAQEILNKAITDKETEIAKFTKLEREFFEQHGYKLGTPIYEGLRDKLVSNGSFDMETFGNTISGYEGKVAYAVASNQYKADEETAYNRAHNSGMGSYDSDPYQQQYRQAYDMIDTLSNQEHETGQLLSALKSAYDDGKITDEEYRIQQSKLLKLQREIRKSSNELSKAVAKMNYSVGHASQLQDIKGDLIKIGVGVGLYNVGKGSPTQIKGFTGR